MVPLFGAIPGGPELSIILLVLLLPIGVGLWVGYDAKNHHMKYPPVWGLGVAVGFMVYVVPGIIAFIIYIYYREKEVRERAAV